MLLCLVSFYESIIFSEASKSIDEIDGRASTVLPLSLGYISFSIILSIDEIDGRASTVLPLSLGYISFSIILDDMI